jgi:hypothetical protein
MIYGPYVVFVNYVMAKFDVKKLELILSNDKF